jgi:hypothetical protein
VIDFENISILKAQINNERKDFSTLMNLDSLKG